MTARKIGQSWWCDFRWNHVRYRKRSPLDTKGGAQAHEIMLRRELMERGSLDRIEKKPHPAPKTLTFAEFAKRWLVEYVDVNNKPSERATKRRILAVDLLPAFGTWTIRDISTAAIDRYKSAKLARGQGPKTINNALSILRTCLTTAVEWDELSAVPRIRVLKTAPPAFRFLSDDDTSRLIATAAPGLWRTMILTASRTGLRFGELIALRWTDVSFATTPARLTVARSSVDGFVGTPKNNRIRHVPLTRDVTNALLTLERAGELVFQMNGREIKRDCATWRLHQACERSGIRPIGWHVLRHTFASALAMRGAPLNSIRELLGHQTMTMTLRYAHLAPGALEPTVALLEQPISQQVWATGGQGNVSGRFQQAFTGVAAASLSAQPSENAGRVPALSSGSP